MNIVLIGMRGTGKSTVAKRLAKLLHLDLFETDTIIAQQAGLTIPEIVEKYGWEHFRMLESAVVQDVTKKQNAVIATGGGVVVNERNIEMLQEMGFIVLLTATIETMLLRIGDDHNRPLLAGQDRKQELEIIWRERQPLYEEAANMAIDTTDKSPKIIAEIIAKHLAQKNI